jgi:hypothetical protein
MLDPQPDLGCALTNPAPIFPTPGVFAHGLEMRTAALEWQEIKLE